MSDRRPGNERKARQNEDFDFISQPEQRKHRRVGSGAFAGIPVVLTPAPPFFGSPLEGTMVDLSGGGTAVVMNEAVPVKTKMKIWIAFPDREAVTCLVSVRRVSPKDNGFLTGLQFLDLPESTAADLVRISTDYDECERRIRETDAPACQRSCAFFGLCDKPLKTQAPPAS